ncbi:MAG TPA: amidohydrolase family protein, partial [Thermoanaerobaculia bacterium]|nr:amidohydrolase family protein [Thermoanaerobaculia bacterium]
MHTLLLALLLATTPPAADPPPAELVLQGGRIVTMDPARPEAEALAVADGRIVALGTKAEIAPRIGPRTRVIELAGRLAIPGFIESHAHFQGIGRAHLELALAGTTSWEEVVASVAAAVAKAPAGEWIRGRGWHQEKWRTPPVPAVE